MRHRGPRRRAVVVAVPPGVHSDFGADEIHPMRGTLGERHAPAIVVDRNRRLVTMLHGPDDVLGPPRRVTTEEDPRARALHRGAVDDRHPPIVELDADVPLDPGESVLLT